ncbi:class I SAM-dependent methyltransferase [Marinomonas agarivorans]|nr:class I SAM-dependent methyltransferase [Marinomonas agarivorans]
MESLFNISSSGYAKGRPTYPAELYLWLAQQAKNRERVWDCACGTGQVSVDLTAYFTHVEASDISEEHIAEATPHRKIHYQVSSSETTSYPDNHFDVICVGQALHCFDLERFWPEAIRLLKPEGLFVCWGYSGLKISDEFDQIIANSVLPSLLPHWPKQNKIIWNRYSKIDFPFEMIQVPDFELSLKWNAYRVFDYMKTWTAWRALPEQEANILLNAAWEKVVEIWPDPNQKRVIHIPFFAKAGRLKKRH